MPNTSKPSRYSGYNKPDSTPVSTPPDAPVQDKEETFPLIQEKKCAICGKVLEIDISNPNPETYKYVDIDPEKENGEEVVCVECNSNILSHLSNNKGDDIDE